MIQISACTDEDEQNWRHFGVAVLRTMLAPSKSEFELAPPTLRVNPSDIDGITSHILHAIEAAKNEVISFLKDLAVICQLLIPNSFCLKEQSQHDSQVVESTIKTIKRYMALFNLESHRILLQSNLLQEVMKSWYARSTGNSTNQLDSPRMFHGITWPVPSCVGEPDIPTNCVPLLGNSFSAMSSGNGLLPRISCLPKSYTDLYATLSELYPDCEQTSVCLVCGQVRSR